MPQGGAAGKAGMGLTGFAVGETAGSRWEKDLLERLKPQPTLPKDVGPAFTLAAGCGAERR